MKFKLIIADDEAMMRNGLSKLVKWDELGFELVGVFKDGLEVIEYLTHQTVHVVLTDIKMTTLTGLDVAKYIFDHELHTKVVIFSGYKDFEYAQDAIKYGVAHYLLKPVLMPQIKEVFANLYETLLDESTQEEAISSAMARYHKLSSYLELQFIQSAALGMLSSSDEFYKHANALELSEEWLKKQCALFNIALAQECNRAHIETILSVLDEHLQFISLGMEENQLHVVVLDKYNSGALYEACFASNLEGKLHALSGIHLKVNSVKNFQTIRELSKYVPNYVAPLEVPLAKRSDALLNTMRYIDTNYMKNISLTEVAEYVFLSPVYLSRLFKERRGETFIEYLTQTRIDAAKELLKNTDVLIYEICERVGYNNLKYFYRMFKRTTGCSPSDYRRQCRSKVP